MKQRPVYLNLFHYRFPITAIVSILHRLSGIGLFFFIPFILWVLDDSLKSEQDFLQIKNIFTTVKTKIFFWLVINTLFYHCIAGIRHLLMDIHLGDSKKAGRLSAIFVLGILLIFMNWTGYQLWCT